MKEDEKQPNGEVKEDEKLPPKELTDEEKTKVRNHQELSDGNIKTAASAAIASAAVKAKVYSIDISSQEREQRFRRRRMI